MNEPAAPRELDWPRWTPAVAALLVVLVVTAFWPALSALYVSWDDIENFVQNERWWGLSAENVRWMLTNRHMGHYTPLTWLSFGVQYELVGGHPAWSHGINIGLHAVNAILFFVVSRRVLAMLGGMEGEVAGVEHTGGRAAPPGYSLLLTLAAGLSAAFFAVHPLRVESVAWATERRDVLSTTFLLCSLLAYLRAVQVGRAAVRDWRWYWAAVGLLFLSCASKAWGMSFFVVLLALDMYPLRRVVSLRGWFTAQGMRVIAEKVPFVVIGQVTAVVASRAVREVAAAKTLEEWSIADRLIQASYGLTFYVKQTVAPSTHSPLYEIPPEISPWEPRFVLSYIVVAALAVLGLWAWKRARGLTIGLFIYVVQVSPVLGFLQSGDQMVADRYSYLATMPFAIMLGWLAVRLVSRAEQREGQAAGRQALRLTGLVGAAMVGALVAASYAQTTVWRDSKTLWTYAAEVTPTGRVLAYLGRTVSAEDPDRARDLYRASVEADPTQGNHWYEYATLLRNAGELREAERAYLEAAQRMPQRYVARVDLGVLYETLGRRDEALEQFKFAAAEVERAPPQDRQGRPFLVLGLALLDRGRRDEAAAAFREAARYPDVGRDAASKLRDLGVTP